MFKSGTILLVLVLKKKKGKIIIKNKNDKKISGAKIMKMLCLLMTVLMKMLWLLMTVLNATFIIFF